jgi:pimeloyl-ACP methyl ester carboxylesterase
MEKDKGDRQMPTARINGVKIYYEVHGQGVPIVWSHEFAGDWRSWEPQVNYFSRRYQVVTYNARGYPPSDVPDSPEAYSQEQSVDDLCGLLDHLEIETAHVAGLSMGGSVTLNFGIKYPHRVRSLIVAGAGSGSSDPEAFRDRVNRLAQKMESEGMSGVDDFGRNPNRLPFLRKDPKGWQKMAEAFQEHSPIGSAHTFRRVQGLRPSSFSLEDRLQTLMVPTLIMVGDEDEGCLAPSLFMKRKIPHAGLAVFPKSGHVINLEEPALFNALVMDFVSAVDAGQWKEE